MTLVLHLTPGRSQRINIASVISNKETGWYSLPGDTAISIMETDQLRENPSTTSNSPAENSYTSCTKSW